MLALKAPQPLDTDARRRERGIHWSARPLPPPVRSHRVSFSSRVPHDRLDEQLALWIEELCINGTYGGD